MMRERVSQNNATIVSTASNTWIHTATTGPSTEMLLPSMLRGVVTTCRAVPASGGGGSGTSRPSTLARRLPCRRKRSPPALVAMLPPIWQLPLAPRSKGMQNPRSPAYSSSASSTQPLSATTTPCSSIALEHAPLWCATSVNGVYQPQSRQVSLWFAAVVPQKAAN